MPPCAELTVPAGPPAIDDLLAWPDVAGCIVCTPNDTHVDIGLAVAQAGKHLLMEKPLAITVEGAQRLELTFRERNLVAHGRAHTPLL